VKRVNGWWLPSAEQHLVPFLQRDGSYQARHRTEALSHVKRWRRAVDIGAHIGLWARELAERFDSVLAFEPVEAHRACFLRNVGAINVELSPFALGERPGLVAFDWDGKNTGHARVAEGIEGDIPMRTLDEYELEDVDFVKVDAEGYEVKILRGSQETLLRCRPVVCVEQKRWVYEGEHQYSAVEFLASLGMVQLARVSDDIVMGWDG
jgi:FkbM family methyltransferase